MAGGVRHAGGLTKDASLGSKEGAFFKKSSTQATTLEQSPIQVLIKLNVA